MIVEVKVKPGSKKQDINKINDKEYSVNLKERAENNKANIELLKLLKKHFNAEVKIVKGAKNKNKVVRIG